MRIETVNPLLHHSGLDAVIQLYRERQVTFYNRMTGEVSTKSLFYRAVTESDMNPAIIIGQGMGIDFQDFLTPYFQDTYPKKRGVGFSISTEAEESEQYGIFAKRGPKMARAIQKSIEADCANFMNLATSTSHITTPDALALASSAHLTDGSTGTNIISGNPALSVTSLATGITNLRRQPSHTNDPSMFAGPFDLWVPPELEDLANRLAKTRKYPTTNNNDDNWVGSMLGDVVVNPYFTSTTAWALVASDKDDNPLKMLNRRKLITKSFPDGDKDGNKYTATQIWAFMAQDWRNFAFSAGA